MFDVKWIRENPEDFDAGMARRGLGPKAQQILELDSYRRDLITQCQALQQERNKASKLIGSHKSKGESVAKLVAEVGKLKKHLQADENRIKETDQEIKIILSELPNLPCATVPDGLDEKDNVEVRKVSTPRSFDHDIKF
ncbi:uncharacterized protein METZ01_LOCUS496716, partial [marine metagenome]